MSSSILHWAAAAMLAAAPGLAAHAGGYGDDGGRFGRYGYGYAGNGGGAGYEDAGYSGGNGGYGDGAYGAYGSSPWSAPAHYCREHLEYHLHQAWMNDQAPYHDWWGTGGPEAWHQAMEEDHARFHYTHPGSWRCEYQGWPSG